MTRASTARGFRWGQLIAGIEGACAQLELARRSADLLSDEDQAKLANAIDALMGIEQRAWARKHDQRS